MSSDLVFMSNILSKTLQLTATLIKAVKVSSFIATSLVVHCFLLVSGIDCLLTWFAKF